MKQYVQEFREILFVKSVKGERLILISIIAFALFLRLFSIEKPMLDRTLWKEIDHIEISSNYVTNHHNFIKPTITWPAEPPRVTAMELPLVPYLTSFLYPLFGKNPYTVRFITLLSFTLLPLIMFWLVRLEFGAALALLSAFFAAFIPLFNRQSTIMFSEPPLILFSVLSVYLFYQYLEKNTRRYLIYTVIAFSITVSLKPDSLYMIIPIVWLQVRKHGFDWSTYKKPLIGFLIALIIPVLWYAYAYWLTEHSIDVFGIFGGHNKFQTWAMITWDVWRETMFKRITGSMGGKTGCLLFLAGLVVSLYLNRKNVFHFYLLAMVVFVLVVAEGNMDTPYRQVVFSPVISHFMALSFLLMAYIGYKVIAPLTTFIRIDLMGKVLLIGLLLVSLYALKGSRTLLRLDQDPYAAIHEKPWELATELKKYVHEDSKIITVGEYGMNKGGNDLSPVIYYYSHVRGWSLQNGQWDVNLVERLIGKGADIFVGQYIMREDGLDDFVEQVRAKYKVLYENKEKQQIIISLK